MQGRISKHRRLRELRLLRGLSASAMAVQLGITRATLSNIERGTRNPSPELAARIAEFLGTGMAGLVGEKAKALAQAESDYFRAVEDSGLPQEKDDLVHRVSLHADRMMRNAHASDCRDLDAIKSMAQDFQERCVTQNADIREAALAMARARIQAGEAPATCDLPTWAELLGTIQRSLKSRGDQARLAEHLNVSRQRLHRYVKGKDNPPADLVLQMVRWVRDNAGISPPAADPRD
jgi:transcriptional regulator with XRE-family HTH domain